MNSDITALLEQVKEGNRQAFGQLYELTYSDIFRTVSMLIYQPHDRDDVISEIYIALWKSIDKYQPSLPFRHWLHGLVIRRIQDWRRKQWRLLRVKEKVIHSKPEQLHWDEYDLAYHSDLLNAVSKLSYKLREVIILRYLHSYSLGEIADILGIAVGTVKSRHHAALNKLQKEYAAPGGNEEARHVY